VALAVLLPLLEPAAVAVSAWAATRPHECADHSCLCRARRCPPKRAAAGCHKQMASEVAMTGGCHHEQAPNVGAITPYVLPPPTTSLPMGDDEPAPVVLRADTRPGFSRLDSPPPRSL
jgi:hypothetical protein